MYQSSRDSCNIKWKLTPYERRGVANSQWETILLQDITNHTEFKVPKV